MITTQTVKTHRGNEIIRYILTNKEGMKVEVLNLGATLTKIIVPDDKGNYENVVLEWEDIDTYEENPGYLGAVVGRVAGRIHQGRITLEDKRYHLSTNENEHTLHGGYQGFHSKFWQAKDTSTSEETRLTLSYESPDGEEGFPGNLKVSVTYILREDNQLILRYEGTTDQTTVVNLTNHAYFNLSGNGKRDILGQEVYIQSDAICQLDEQSIPTGHTLDLTQEKDFDFRQAKPLGRDIHHNNIQLKYGKGYDHIWFLNQKENVIELYDAISRRCLTISTTEPCVVMYTMNNPPSEKVKAKEQHIRYGVCFETQKCGIGYNEVYKEADVLKPGEVYLAETTYKFTIR